MGRKNNLYIDYMLLNTKLGN